MKSSKKTVVITGALGVLTAVAGTLAYFTDSDSKVNKIKIGKIDIDLQEPNWDKLSDTNKDGTPDVAEKVVPTQTIAKDPTVKNIGVNDAYVYLKVTVPKKSCIITDSNGLVVNNGSGTPDTSVKELFIMKNSSGDVGINSGWTLLSSVTTDANVNTYVYGYNTKIAPNTSTALPLFSSVTFINAIEGQGLENSVQNINIEAYGIQSDETGTMQQAYTKYVNQNA